MKKEDNAETQKHLTVSQRYVNEGSLVTFELVQLFGPGSKELTFGYRWLNGVLETLLDSGHIAKFEYDGDTVKVLIDDEDFAVSF